VIVMDACVLIAFFNAADAHHDRARLVLRETAGHERAASPITLAEVLVGPARTGRLDEARDALDKLRITQVAIGLDAPSRLARLRADTGLKLPDCCVVLAALDGAAQAIATLDDRLAAASRDLGFLVLPSADLALLTMKGGPHRVARVRHDRARHAQPHPG
jgi:predicted nucleic acid-binding protein